LIGLLACGYEAGQFYFLLSGAYTFTVAGEVVRVEGVAVEAWTQALLALNLVYLALGFSVMVVNNTPLRKVSHPHSLKHVDCGMFTRAICDCSFNFWCWWRFSFRASSSPSSLCSLCMKRQVTFFRRCSLCVPQASSSDSWWNGGLSSAGSGPVCAVGAARR
jgi:hypothetical protein